MKLAIVYVRLLDEGTDVYRPTQAEILPNAKYRLLPTVDYDPVDESWEFLPSSIVYCKEILLQGGVRVVAVELATIK